MTILTIREHPEYAKQAISYFQDKWATEDSLKVYEDSITRSVTAKNPLPIWYLLVQEDEIIGCAGLITNDFISCTDLYPWLAALYIEEEFRGNRLSKLLIDKVIADTKEMGFPSLYLCTDHIGLYEKYGLNYIGDGYHPWGESSRVYDYVIKAGGSASL